MKKIAIITRHGISNYGSLFQAYALERTIRDLGYDAQTIDYILTEERSWNLCRIDIEHSAWNANPWKRCIFFGINMPNRAIQFAKFGRFRRELLHLTKEYNSFEALKKNPPSADIYCTGSDQVWNETIHNKPDWCYFLDFLGEEARFAYAASFGKDCVREDFRDRITESLSKYKKISVRETSGSRILKEMGLRGDVVLDPTLLLNGSQWEQMMGNARAPKEKYVLLYQIHKNDALVDYARKFAQKAKCKVINIGVSYTQKKKGMEFRWLPDYKEVLALFRDAHCVVTDSFHATVFSINFNRQFVTILPKHSAARIQSILTLMGLGNRVLTDTADLDLPEQIIDYCAVNAALEQLRKESRAWLKDTLEEFSGEKTMNTVCDLDTCTGCMACVNICPKQAISIVDSLETLNAQINPEKCIDCGLCGKYCPNLHPMQLQHPVFWKQGWAEENIRRNSSSGGAAAAITRTFLQSGGYVASCLFENGRFGFAVTNDPEKARRFAGSKYVKSDPGLIYQEIKRLLQKGEKVLFIGLPCQAAAVKSICGDHNGLYTADLICHGTPSVRLLRQFLTELGFCWEEIADIQFRDGHYFGVTPNRVRLTPRRVQDSYLRVFLNSVDYTDNCYSCRYAALERVADITLGDAWGQLSETVSGGVSLVLCQTEKGIALVEDAGLQLQEVDLEKAVAANHQLSHPSIKHPGSERFFKLLKAGHSIRYATTAILPKESMKQCLKAGLIRMKLLKDFPPFGGDAV